MKTYEEIKKEISKVHAELTQNEEAKKAEINHFSNMEFRSLKERHEYMVEHKAEKEESLNRIAAMEEKSTELRLALMILKNNLKQSLFAEVSPIIIETMEKYKGKSLGEKTKEKIKNELFEKTNCYVYISSAEISVQKHGANYSHECEFKLYSKYIDGVERKFLVDNKVQNVNINDIGMFGSYDYVEDIEAEVKYLIEKHKRVYQLLEELKEACSEFNDHAPDGIPHVNYYDSSSIRHKIF